MAPVRSIRGRLRRSLPLAAAGIFWLVSTGCVQVAWQRASRYEPVSDAALATLEPGKSGLDDCLHALGAPLWVRERPAKKGQGAVLAWGWYEGRSLGIQVSFAIDNNYSASFEADRIARGMEGVVLEFGGDWTLLRVERGRLRDLTGTVLPPASPQALDRAAGGQAGAQPTGG